jgi:hypothetical protein
MRSAAPPHTPNAAGAPSSPPPAAAAGRPDWLLYLALVTLCAIPFLRAYPHRTDPLGEDEIYWIGQTYYYHLAVEKMDWANPDWRLLPARENPVLGKYVIGAGLRLNGLGVTNSDWLGIFYIIAKDRPNAWGQGADFKDRVAVLDRMTPSVREPALKEGRFDSPAEITTTARAVMVAFGIIAALAVFVLASFYTGRAMAFLVALLFVLHPAVVEAYTAVGVDILAIAFSLIAVIHFVLIERRVWRRWSWPRLGCVLLCASGGISLAFAVGSKLNAAVVGFLGAAMALVWLGSCLRCQSAASRESLKAMLAVLVLALGLFVASNPEDYPNPVAGVWRTYADQQRSLNVQKTIPAVKKPLRTAAERFRALAGLTALYPAVFALVAAAFVYELAAKLRPGRPLPVIALWWFIALLAVGLWLPFARPRYVLPVIAPSVILLGSAVGGCFGRKRPTPA